jgi:hypothetical protein
VFEVDDDFDNEIKVRALQELLKEKQKKEVVPDATFEDDPVALSITSYLIWLKNPSRRWVPVNEVGRVTPEAREMAHELRKYFLHRSTMKVLQGQTPTEFQYKLNAFLSDIRPLKIDELGMLYRLPYFYAEDLDIDYVAENTTNSKQISPVPADSHPLVLTFFPLRKILRSRRSGEVNQYWWTAEPGGVPFALSIRTDNPLMGMINSLFDRDQIQLRTRVKPASFNGYYRDRWYYQLFDIRLP